MNNVAFVRLTLSVNVELKLVVLVVINVLLDGAAMNTFGGVISPSEMIIEVVSDEFI